MHPEAPDDDFMTLFDCKMEMSKQTVEAATMDRTLNTELIVDDQDTAARVLVASRGMFDEMPLPGLPANQASAASNGYNNLYEGSLQFPMCRGSRLADDWADGNHRHCASSESGTPQKDPAAKKDDAKNEDPAAKKDDAKTSAESYEVLMEKARLELATQAEIVERPSSELVAAAVEGAQAVIDQMRPLFDRGEASADEEFMDESNEDIAVRETETQHPMGL
jgi:hypothetical protein